MKKKYKSFLFCLLFLLLFLGAAKLLELDPASFWKRRSHLTDIVVKMLPPDWSYLPSVIKPLAATLEMSVTGSCIGAVLGLLLSPYCAKKFRYPFLCRMPLRIAIQMFRSFPTLILALLATFLFGLGTFAGTIAITISTFSIMTKLTYEDIENAPLSAFEALQTMGCSKTASFYRAVLPEILPAYLTNALYLLETNVRHSAILGYVGAGGIGLLLNEKVSWREYEKVSVILVLFFFTICLIELLTHFLIGLIQGTSFSFTEKNSFVDEKQKNGKDWKGKRKNSEHSAQKPAKVVFLCIVAVFLFCTASLKGPDFRHTSVGAVWNMFHGLLHPDWKFFFRPDKTGVGYLLLETVCISLIGTVLGGILAFPLSFGNTEKIVPAPIAFVFRMLIIAIRSVPFMIYGLIFIRVTGPGPAAGVLTLAVCSIGLLCKRFTECIEAMDFGSYHALRNMGIPVLLCIRHGILPELWPAFRAVILYRFDVNIREASILGLVGAGGIGAPLIFSMNQFAWRQTGALAWGILLLVWITDGIQRKG